MRDWLVKNLPHHFGPKEVTAKEALTRCFTLSRPPWTRRMRR